ncbi:MAG TPA: hypothetical protein VK918_08465 [Pyrinomonadaceae bacterium]|nr:hypothetical protein [Pyrinomonadaceae bacterium]
MSRSVFSIVLVVLALAFVVSAQEEQRKDGRVFWRGTVDAKVQLSIKGITLTEQAVIGRAMPPGNYSFTSRLPDAAVSVSVNKKEGRGSVTVIQQPNSENGFTAIVEIDDSRGGTAEYLLDISWQ